MGNNCCGDASFEQRQRQALLQEGHVFRRKAASFLGLLPTAEKVHVALSSDASCLELRSYETSSSSATLRLGKKKEPSSVPLSSIANVHASGEHLIVLFAADGAKLVELEATQIELRDLWVQTLRELIDGREPVAGNLHDELEKQKQRDKEAYWAARTAELQARKAAADEKKQPFANVGLKYTAQAMLQR
ncbi:hypothetical protein SDRG_01438 [Saprolegnia diclina VS20]|uniref:PH domain-containing protein n=1 Tax=Saprolegnia diclina (strain VS20) TaxID=1156394 RepID=T0R3G1_SAPDV|nr:hypothetical protein SDRG_01438 [Saprolegnia diclina VS20]EQC41471.1 hypothetical protein SDRG_01438 [Saprolegnia diclina VS20]|eukprot:XP_008605185.1 hypothetical protein SDRG_01438 [Saprolegnia diclina VS20]